MNTAYVCGADIGYLGDNQYVTDHFGLCKTVDDAVRIRKKLHTSFPYDIYEVDVALTNKVCRTHGIRQGSIAQGNRVIRLVCYAFDHPAWLADENEDACKALGSTKLGD